MATLVISPSVSVLVEVKLDIGLREKTISLSGPLTTLEGSHLDDSCI